MLSKEEFDALVQNTETVKRWVIVLFLGTLVLVSGTVLAATYGLEDQSGNKLILHDDACKVEFLKGWKRASFRYEGKDLTACWMASKGLVYVLDDLGDLTPVPITMFKKLQEG